MEVLQTSALPLGYGAMGRLNSHPPWPFSTPRPHCPCSFAPVTLARGALLAALYIALACWLFARVHAHVVRSGLLARGSGPR